MRTDVGPTFAHVRSLDGDVVLEELDEWGEHRLGGNGVFAGEVEGGPRRPCGGVAVWGSMSDTTLGRGAASGGGHSGRVPPPSPAPFNPGCRYFEGGGGGNNISPDISGSRPPAIAVDGAEPAAATTPPRTTPSGGKRSPDPPLRR